MSFPIIAVTHAVISLEQLRNFIRDTADMPRDTVIDVATGAGKSPNIYDQEADTVRVKWSPMLAIRAQVPEGRE